MRLRLLVLALLAAAAPPLPGVPLESIPNPRTRDSGWITDLANLLAPSTRTALDVAIDALEAKNGAELAVATIQDTDGRDPKPFATALFNHWGIGKATADNGVLFLVVMGRRSVQVEVGDGLRPHLPDAWVTGMLQSTVVPRFKAGDPDGGIRAGVEALLSRLAEAPAETGRSTSEEPAGTRAPPPPLPPPPPSSGGPPRAGNPLVGFLALGGMGYGAWWLVSRLLRGRPRICTCGQTMRKLDETEDDQYLAPGQRTEEYLGSVDYDVYVCPGCNKSQIEQYKAWLTSYYQCPRCNHDTLDVTSTTLSAATYHSTGTGRKDRTCKSCKFKDSSTYTIARKTKSSSSSTRTGSSSSSSSRSSSSSFGGGRSSGGGGGASW